MKIKTYKYGIIHAIAQCQNCDFEDAIKAGNGMQTLRNKVYAHIRKTGHTVTVETGNTTDYKPK